MALADVQVRGWSNSIGVIISAGDLGPEKALAVRMFELAIRDLVRGTDGRGNDIDPMEAADFLTRSTLYHDILDIDPDRVRPHVEEFLDGSA